LLTTKRSIKSTTYGPGSIGGSMKASYLKEMFDENGGEPIMLRNKRSGKRHLVPRCVFETGIQPSKYSEDDSYVYSDGHIDCQPDWEPNSIRGARTGPKINWFWVSKMELVKGEPA
tara:strand:+ start:964 stop:1311 length:348 start_codon:yes stop_codon:yes gene_type:complete